VHGGSLAIAPEMVKVTSFESEFIEILLNLTYSMEGEESAKGMG